eukprot:PhM_4_TR16670/c0_g1_i1/m.92930
MNEPYIVSSDDSNTAPVATHPRAAHPRSVPQTMSRQADTLDRPPPVVEDSDGGGDVNDADDTDVVLAQSARGVPLWVPIFVIVFLCAAGLIVQWFLGWHNARAALDSATERYRDSVSAAVHQFTHTRLVAFTSMITTMQSLEPLRVLDEGHLGHYARAVCLARDELHLQHGSMAGNVTLTHPDGSLFELVEDSPDTEPRRNIPREVFRYSVMGAGSAVRRVYLFNMSTLSATLLAEVTEPRRANQEVWYLDAVATPYRQPRLVHSLLSTPTTWTLTSTLRNTTHLEDTSTQAAIRVDMQRSALGLVLPELTLSDEMMLIYDDTYEVLAGSGTLNVQELQEAVAVARGLSVADESERGVVSDTVHFRGDEFYVIRSRVVNNDLLVHFNRTHHVVALLPLSSLIADAYMYSYLILGASLVYAVIMLVLLIILLLTITRPLFRIHNIVLDCVLHDAESSGRLTNVALWVRIREVQEIADALEYVLQLYALLRAYSPQLLRELVAEEAEADDEEMDSGTAEEMKGVADGHRDRVELEQRRARRVSITVGTEVISPGNTSTPSGRQHEHLYIPDANLLSAENASTYGSEAGSTRGRSARMRNLNLKRTIERANEMLGKTTLRRADATVMVMRSFGLEEQYRNMARHGANLITSFLNAAHRGVEGTCGVLEAVNGDVIIATWNATRACVTHESAAATCGLNIAMELQSYDRPWGMGLVRGDLVSGVIGTAVHRSTALFGRAVSLASELPHLARATNSKILVNDQMNDHIKELYLTEIVDWVCDRYNTLGYGVYELVAKKGTPEAELRMGEEPRKLYIRGFSAFHAGRYDDAADAFREVVLKCHGHPQARRLLHMSLYFKRNPGRLQATYRRPVPIWEPFEEEARALVPRSELKCGDDEEEEEAEGGFLTSAHSMVFNRNPALREQLEEAFSSTIRHAESSTGGFPLVLEDTQPGLAASAVDLRASAGGMSAGVFVMTESDGSIKDESEVIEPNHDFVLGEDDGDDQPGLGDLAPQTTFGRDDDYGNVFEPQQDADALQAAGANFSCGDLADFVESASFQAELAAGASGFFAPEPISTSSNNGSPATAQQNEGSVRSSVSFEEMPHVVSLPKGRTYTLSSTVLGRGTFGAVYLGLEVSGALVAVKVLRIRASSDRQVLDSLINEVGLLEELVHENVVQYHGSAVYNCYLCLVMECVIAGSLATLLERFGRIPLKTLPKYTRDVLEGLEYLHSNGIVHRDVKPHNVLVTVYGTCKLTDFGASSKLCSVARGDNTPQGSPLYMAPEVIMGNKNSNNDLDRAAAGDVWSVGIMFLHLLTGQIPYDVDENVDAQSFMYRVGAGLLKPRVPDNIDDNARDFVQRCLSPLRSRAKVSELLTHPFLLE